MARYTSTLIKSFGTARHSRTVTAEISDLTINIHNGIEFVSTGTVITAGESKQVVTRGLRLQFVVAPGGAFNLEEGELS